MSKPAPAKRPYTVRLLMSVDALDPSDAVMQFVELINGYGLRMWAYRVIDEEAEEAFFVDGDGSFTKEDDLHGPLEVGASQFTLYNDPDKNQDDDEDDDEDEDEDEDEDDYDDDDDDEDDEE